jgi:tetratricopeptide (TPR) repeat protein
MASLLLDGRGWFWYLERRMPIHSPAVGILVLLMGYAAWRACQSAYVLVREGLLQWQGERALAQLASEVEQGRRTSFELFMQHGMHHLQMHDSARARAFFEAATAAHPMSAHGWYGQGLARRASHFFGSRLQEETLQHALDIDPHHEGARLLLTDFYRELGHYAQAIAELDKLPAETQPEGLREVLQRSDAGTLDEPMMWVRLTSRQVSLLLGMQVCLALLVVLDPSQTTLAGLLFALLLPFHVMRFWRLRTDADGFVVQTIRKRWPCRWSELLDVVEDPRGGVHLLTKTRDFFISAHWAHYPALLTRLKNHLYERGWVPTLRQGETRLGMRPVLS